MMVLCKIKDFFKIDNKYSVSKASFIAVMTVALLAYNLLLIYGFTNPDGINEGLFYYTAADWASAGCGRWLIRYYNLLHRNLVIPVIAVIEYGLFSWIASIAIAKLFDIKNIFYICIYSSLLVVSPGVITQMLYVHTCGAYGLAFLCSVLFVYFCVKEDKIWHLLGSLCLAFAMGLYQSYLGCTIGLIAMWIAFQLVNGKRIHYIIETIIRFFTSGILALLLYATFFKIDLLIFGLESKGRVAGFSLLNILSTAPNKFLEMYAVFFENINDGIVGRQIIYPVFYAFVLFIIVNVCYKMFKDKKLIECVAFVAMVLILPAALNVIGILIPYNNVNLMMASQNYIIIPFVFSLLEKQMLTKRELFGCAVSFMTVCLTWSYVLSANATYRFYKMSYDHINTEMTVALYDVYKLDGYEKDVTPIMLGGFPDNKVLKEKSYINRYGIEIYPNVVFWEDMVGVLDCRQKYFLNCLGVDAGYFGEQDYYDVMTSEEFNEMPIWPKEGSVRMINGFAVVKYRDDPLLPSWD